MLCKFTLQTACVLYQACPCVVELELLSSAVTTDIQRFCRSRLMSDGAEERGGGCEDNRR